MLVLMPKQEAKELVYRLVGKRITEAREAKGLSQLALAQQLQQRGVDIQRTSITHMEKGVQRVMLHFLYPIADVLGIAVSSLLPPKEEFAATSSEMVRESPGGDWVMEVLNAKSKKQTEKNDANKTKTR